MSSIYNIEWKYLQLVELLEENGGELTEELELELQALEENRDELIESMCKSIANKSRDVASIDSEIERLSEIKQNNIKSIDATKKGIIKILKLFGMRSANKKSKGYAFKTALFSGFTRSFESVIVDDVAIESQFAPITGKTSKYINYKIDAKVDHTQLLRLNELGILPVTSFSTSVDKKLLKEYLLDVAQSQTENNVETDDAPERDSIADYVSISSNESLIIK